MSSDEKKVGLPKPPLFTSDYIAMAEILQFAMERFGQLILALMYYTADGTVPDNLPSDINMMFAIYQRKIDAAREKYKDKCAKLAENGAKGGKAKAAKAAGDHPPAPKKVKFSPPTLNQFRDAVAHFYENDELGDDMPDDYDVDSLYDRLKEKKWEISGKSLQNRRDWELVILNRFTPYEGDSPIKGYELFCFAFGNFPELRDSDGVSLADSVTICFDEQYDKRKDGWTIDGEFFPAREWRQALTKYIPVWLEQQEQE